MCKVMMDMLDNEETDEKEVQDASRRGAGGVPQIYKITQDWWTRGLV